MKVDRSKLRTVAFKALSDFLAKLHIYKSMGDYDSAKKFFDHYSEVDEEMLKVRRHVLINKLPRRLELQPNLFLQENLISYKDYEPTFEGLIQSYVERFDPNLMEDVLTEFLKYADLFRYRK